MRFLQKYDLLEAVSSKPLEVFIAQESSIGVRRLVHLLELQGTSGEVTEEQVLQFIRKIAPEPLGKIVQGGRYQSTSYVYLVTTFPEDFGALQKWVQAYETFARDAVAGGGAARPREETAPPPAHSSIQDGKADSSSFRISHEPKPAPVEQAGDFTRAFGGHGAAPLQTSDSDHSPAAGSPIHRSNEKPAPPGLGDPDSVLQSESTGPFTRGFRLGIESDQSPNRTRARSGGGPIRSDAGSFTQEFFSIGPNTSQSEPAASDSGIFSPKSAEPQKDRTETPIRIETERNSEPPNAEPKTGEFTRFFRSPMQPGSRVPPSNPLPETEAALNMEIGKKRPGEFTQIFSNAPTDNAASGFRRSAPYDGKPDGSGLSTNFGQTNFETISPERKESSSSLFDAPQPMNRPSSPFESSATIPQPTWNNPEKSDATKVFAPPPEPLVAPPLLTPAGPSEFTVIVSGRTPQAPALEPVPPSLPQAIPLQIAPAVIPTVPMPAMPVLPVPQVPQFSFQPPAAPAPPVMPAPPVPAFAMPPVPQAPPVPLPAPTAAPKPVSYLPLIITLNVILVIAVALVLYFALKPH